MKMIPKEQVGEVLDKLEYMHPDASCALDFGSVFQLIVAVSLSAQTTDASVNKVTPELFGRYPTPDALAGADPEDVQRIIRPTGFYRNKSANIIAMADMLRRDYGGEVPSSREELVKLPGVGRKTANVVMAEGFGIPAIAVDTHVFRVSKRIGLADGSTPDEVEEWLRSRIPEDRWIRAHHLLIFHGRRICHARRPGCESCGIAGKCLYKMEETN